MNSDNWRVEKHISGHHVLIHKHPEFCEGVNESGCFYKNSNWICLYCKESPPPNVALFAELCFCYKRSPIPRSRSVYLNIPTSYRQAKNILKDRETKTLGHQTCLSWGSNEDIDLIYYWTPIVKFYPDESVRINPGRWETTTTKQRINTALAKSAWHIASDKGIWWWWRYYPWVKFCEFENGDRVYLNPDLLGQDGIFE